MAADGRFSRMALCHLNMEPFVKNNRKSRNISHFDTLESRQMMAADLSATTQVPAGGYGANDLFDVTVSLKNSGSTSDLPEYVFVTLSKDKVFGNADDIQGFASGVFLGTKGGKTATYESQVHVQSTWAAGDYYVVTQADPYNSEQESNEKNNVTFSAKKDIRIVTEKLADGAIIRGTPKNDVITVQGNWANDIITMNGKSYRYEVAANLKPLSIQAGKGDDKITVAHSNLRHILSGNAGNDTITGGNGGDTIWGDAGNDRIYAGAGADVIHGGSGNDIIDGGAGKDTIYADGGKDKVKNSAEDIFQGVETKF
jgi:Ca2+-binding RTX toxin-like protein